MLLFLWAQLTAADPVIEATLSTSWPSPSIFAGCPKFKFICPMAETDIPPKRGKL